MSMFEGFIKYMFKTIKNIELTEAVQRMKYSDAMRLYGIDKPDLRFGLTFVEITDLAKGKVYLYVSLIKLSGICSI